MSQLTFNRGIGGHQQPNRGRTEDWLTPPLILTALGSFDLDPACPPDMPWRTATTMLTRAEDGLTARYCGRVFMNPPYGASLLGPWLSRLADHGNGIALVFARTETAAFVRHGWGRADAMLFLAGRLHFHYPDGSRAKANSGAPSVLIAYGGENVAALATCGLPGALVPLRKGGR